MSINPEEMAIESATAEILKPIDDLFAKEAAELKEADAQIASAEAKMKKVVREAKRDDEQEKASRAS